MQELKGNKQQHVEEPKEDVVQFQCTEQGNDGESDLHAQESDLHGNLENIPSSNHHFPSYIL